MNRKIVIIASILMLVLLFVNMIYQYIGLRDIEKSKQSGNDRWLQVENRIVSIEEKINKIDI